MLTTHVNIIKRSITPLFFFEFSSNNILEHLLSPFSLSLGHKTIERIKIICTPVKLIPCTVVHAFGKRKKKVSPNTVRNNAIIIVVWSVRNHSTVLHIQGRCQRNKKKIKKTESLFFFSVKIRQETSLYVIWSDMGMNHERSQIVSFFILKKEKQLKQYLFTQPLMFAIVWHTLPIKRVFYSMFQALAKRNWFSQNRRYLVLGKSYELSLRWSLRSVTSYTMNVTNSQLIMPNFSEANYTFSAEKKKFRQASKL